MQHIYIENHLLQKKKSPNSTALERHYTKQHDKLTENDEAPLCCPYVNELLKSLLVCVCQALIGLMKESGRSHMCCINSVIMGSCKSVFISVHWNNLAETAVEGGKKIVFISLCVFLFPLPRCRACTEIVRMPGNEWKKGSGITWGGVSSVSWG